MQPGTKAQLKPTFPKDKSAKKDKDKEDHGDDDGSTTETEERIRAWMAMGESVPRPSDGAAPELGAVLEEAGEPGVKTERSASRPRTAEGRRGNRTFPPPAGLEKVQLGESLPSFGIVLEFERLFADRDLPSFP